MSVAEKSDQSPASALVRGPKLSGAKRSSSSRRRTSILDFDLSKFQHSRDQKDSYSSAQCPSIVPLPADVKHKVEKRVVFKIEYFPPLTKVKSSTLNMELCKQLSSSEVLAEAVKYSLDHKDYFCQEFSNFLEYEKFTDVESSIQIQQYAQERDSGTQEEAKFLSVALEGNLQVMGPSKDHVHLIQSRMTLSSKMASPGESPELTGTEDIWPWPWLNPEIRAKSLYKSPVYSRVTFANQRSLPNIPLPLLGNSLRWYLQSVQPCVNAKTFSDTVNVVNDFAKEEGRKYHEHLINALEFSRSSWIRDFLPNYSHCYSRQEAPMLNTAIVAPFMYDLWPEKADSQTIRAAILIELAAEFWQLIRDERLLPLSVSLDGQPSCMHEFRKLFSSVKLPGIPRDEIFYCFNTNPELVTSKHIVVFYKGQIFSFDILSTYNVRFSAEEIKRRLINIIKSVDEGTCEKGPGVGILTSLNRNAWSELRIHLMEMSMDNSASLHEIERAMFVLSLDHTTGCDTDRLPHNAIFGNGFNRWYDKSLNFCVSLNGLVTVNSCTSILEGSTVAFLLNYMHLRIMEDADKWDDDVLISISATAMDISRASSRIDDLLLKITSRVSLMSDVTAGGKEAERTPLSIESEVSLCGETKILLFELDDKLESAIENAKADFIDMSLSLRTAVCRFEEYDSNIFTTKAINKDAFAHLVMQLTFFRMYYRQASVGSRVSLRRFHYGRYEIMRATTSEAVEWCKIMLDPYSSFDDRKLRFLRAEKRHKFLLKNSLNGRGSENHLAALRVIAEDIYSTTPKLFEDEGFRVAGGSRNFDIYSECLGMDCTSCPVVWPTSFAGYGVGYFIARSKIVFNITSWEDDPGTSAELFAHGVNLTLKVMHDLLKQL